MPSSQTIASIRFGFGLGPNTRAKSVSEHLIDLTKPDEISLRYPGHRLEDGLDLAREFYVQAKAKRKGMSGADARYKDAHKALRTAFRDTVSNGFARIADSQAPLRERLTWFWVDHFTAVAKQAPMRGLAGPYIDEAIRPNITGKFSDLLKAVVTHPFMLRYLDQASSIGPNSVVGKSRGKGLNENLAREVMELHTLGVEGAYSQKDVGKLAELMTGLSVNLDKGFVFRANIAEPGKKDFFGKSYGGPRPDVDHVLKAMEALATHPDTARHIAWKLAVHFTSDTPDPTLVLDLERTFQVTDGDLMAVYETLLTHPAATSPLGAKAKQPLDFIGSSIVALGVRGKDIQKMSNWSLNHYLFRPLAAMGQPFLNAPGPDGWPEKAEDWITPQGLAARITWSMALAKLYQKRAADPRRFLAETLGDIAGPKLNFAVRAAENRETGLGLVLASAEFNRR